MENYGAYGVSSGCGGGAWYVSFAGASEASLDHAAAQYIERTTLADQTAPIELYILKHQFQHMKTIKFYIPTKILIQNTMTT